MPEALAVQSLRKRYGATEALKGVDITIGEGELVGLLGPNGAGKSTFVKIVCGLVRADEAATVAGQRGRRLSGISRSCSASRTGCSADEVLLLHQKLARSAGGATERAELLELVGLGEVPDRRVGAMSKGMQQRLGIAQAMIGTPKLLLLDEPTSALDPAGRRTVRELLETLRERGVAVLLNSHLLSRGRARLRPRGDHRARRGGRGRHAGGALAGRAACEVETGRGVRAVRAGHARGHAADRARAGRRRARTSTSVRVVRSSLGGRYLEVVGGR